MSAKGMTRDSTIELLYFHGVPIHRRHVASQGPEVVQAFEAA